MHNYVLDFFILYGVFIVGEILLFLTLCHMLYQRRSPTSLISWLLFMIVLPYISVLLYFLIGKRKQSDSRSKSSLEIKSSGGESAVVVNSIDGILRSNGITGVSEHNSFELITDSVKAFENMMDEIQKAKKSISMSTYVFKKDAMTEQVLGALTQKASQGVQVRVLIDSLGSYAIYFFQGEFKKLRQAGGEVHFFMPLLRLPYRNYINLRNHRKIYLFDEHTLLSGGMNLSDEYMGPAKSPGQWEDVLFKTEGEATYQYAQIFENDWAYATGNPLRQAALTSAGVHGDAYIQVIPSGPDIKGDALYKALISAIHTVKERIWIVTPYFVPDESLFLALKIAKLKGVDVKLITPKTSNHFIADLGRSSYMRELAESGIELVLYNGSMLHAKAILLDSYAAMIGSVNIDNRSLLLNYEVVSFAYSETIIKEVDAWMQGFMIDAEQQMPEASRIRRIAENFMRILAPQL
jgi:cardiolipin synthase